MGKGRHRSQDLDQALSIQLAGSTAGRNELCQSDVVHTASPARVDRIPIRAQPGCRSLESPHRVIDYFEPRSRCEAYTRCARAPNSVTLAEGTGPNRELLHELEELAPEVYAVGDCDGVGYIPGAILDTALLARRL
jgi:hypothetical protein